MKLAQITGITSPPGLKPEFSDRNSALNLGGLVSRILTFAIIGAGLFFFVRIISAGYVCLISLGDSAKIESATKELTNALIGLLIVISAYFLAQILQVIFGINILTDPLLVIKPFNLLSP